MSFDLDERSEWLEADGVGGFAMGTATGVRTRRYHALLIAATTPPTGRMALVNAVDAWVNVDGVDEPVSFHRFRPGVTTGGASVIESFTHRPWPTWVIRTARGVRVQHEVIVKKGAPRVGLSWRVLGGPRCVLKVRPLISGRDYHALHHENSVFRFDAEWSGDRVSWSPYAGVPRVHATHNGAYAHDPVWYRGFEYAQERERGFECEEDLASPGVLTFDLGGGEARLVFSCSDDRGGSFEETREAERARRSAFASEVERAGDAYVVEGDRGTTIVAGYPWFVDWGRDTCIAVRGLCIATGRYEEAVRILVSWAQHLRGGLLPNRFPERGEEVEYNTVDASLWFVIAVMELKRAIERGSGSGLSREDGEALDRAVLETLNAYASGTAHNIKMDEDGLISAGAPGVQLTWMDARVGERVITPRRGKPVEIQALWLNALHAGAAIDDRWAGVYERALKSFRTKFWNEERGCLYDVVDVEGVVGACDASMRPNQILAVGGLPLSLLGHRRARKVVDAVERELLTPVGVRTLAPGSEGYAARYEGGPSERDSVYHQGPAWPWLMGPFVEAWVRTRDDERSAKSAAVARFLQPMLQHVREAGLGHVSELVDAEAPHTPRGCPFQAWSVAELIRLERMLIGRAEKSEAARRPLAGAML